MTKKWSRAEVAATMDHAALMPTMSDANITEQCELGARCKTASVCVRPSDAPLAAKVLEGSGVPVCVVVGFPHGSNRPEVKALEGKLAIQDGATELDMVINIGKLMSEDYDWVKRDIEGVVAEAKAVEGVKVKVIIESCYLSPEQIVKACELARDAGANWVKTSTGFGSGGATPEAIELMIKTVGDVMQVKASGGVRDYETACGYLNQGCTRLGTAGGTSVICENAPETGGEY